MQAQFPPPSAHAVPSRTDQILGLDLGRAHLALLGALLNLRLERLLLALEFGALLVDFSNGAVQHALVLTQTLGRRHALAKRPLQDLPTTCERCGREADGRWDPTFMAPAGVVRYPQSVSVSLGASLRRPRCVGSGGAGAWTGGSRC